MKINGESWSYTTNLLGDFFYQCDCHFIGTKHGNATFPLDNVIFIHAVKEKNYYKVPCFIESIVAKNTDNKFIHPRFLNRTLNIILNNDKYFRSFSTFLKDWLNVCCIQPLRLAKKGEHVFGGPGFLLDNKGNCLLLATVDVYSKFTDRSVNYAGYVHNDITENNRNQMLNTIYVNNPTLIIHPRVNTDKKLFKLKHWIKYYVTPICQTNLSFTNRELGSDTKENKEYKITIIYKEMDQFFSRVKEPFITEDITDKINSLILKNTKQLKNIYV